MNKNIAFLQNGGEIFISLRSIAETICLPEQAVRCRLFEKKVDRNEYIKRPDSFYISEDAACQLLTDIEKLHPEAKDLERFHFWMHRTFDEIAQETEEEDPREHCDRPDCIGCEHEDDDDSGCELGEFLDMILIRLADLELRVSALEERNA